jgi:hypothetical protein
MVKKNLIVAVLATFCLTAILFTISPVNSLSKYDPWLDSFTGDGKIDARDVSPVSAAYGATGDPTRPVVIANLSTYEWVGWQVVDPGQYWDILNSTRGYRTVTIIAAMQTNSHVNLEVSFEIFAAGGGARGPWDITSLYNAPGGENRIIRTYNVVGSTIWIALNNTELALPVGVYVAIYMTT